ILRRRRWFGLYLPVERKALDRLPARVGEGQRHRRLAVVVGRHVEKYRDSGRQILASRTVWTKPAHTARDQPALLRLEQVRRIGRHLGGAQPFQELEVVEHVEAA